MKRLINPFGLLAVCLLALVVGCAQLGVPTPKTFEDKAYATLSAADQVVLGARAALAAKKISPADAVNIANGAQAVKDGVDVARQVMKASGPDAGLTRLQVAIAAVSALQLYLATKGAT